MTGASTRAPDASRHGQRSTGPGPGPVRARCATTISGRRPAVEYGEASVVTATVAPAAATGTVRVLLNGTVVGTGTLSGGKATISIAGKVLSRVPTRSR